MTSNCIGDFAHWERVVSLISICNCCIYHSFVQNHLFVFNFCHTFLRLSWFIRFHQKSSEKNKSEVWSGANSFEDTFSFLFLSWNFSSYLHFAPFVKLPTFYHLYDEEIDVLFSCKSLYIGQDIVKETVGAFLKIKIKNNHSISWWSWSLPANRWEGPSVLTRSINGRMKEICFW